MTSSEAIVLFEALRKAMLELGYDQECEALLVLASLRKAMRSAGYRFSSSSGAAPGSNNGFSLP